jgi:hypothetical protein
MGIKIEVKWMSESVIIEQDKKLEDKLSKVLQDCFSITKTIDTNDRLKVKTVISNYVSSYYLNGTISDLNSSFFDKFYCVYLPELNVYLSDFEQEEIAKALLNISQYIEKRYGLNNLSEVCHIAFNRYTKELKRIYYVTREFRKYSIMPVLCWDPFIIDINCYKNMKRQEHEKDKYIVYEYGFFILEEVINANLIFVRDGLSREFYKIKIDAVLAAQMRKGDITHMSLKRRLFATSWDIIKVKTYYNMYARPYIFSGGMTSEKI